MNLICISGSSGVGKTTIAKLLQYILGEDQSLYLSGDDLHKWSRDSSNWETKTHLNPESNNLEIGYIHIRDLMRGLSIQRSLYDHITGKFKEPIEIHPKKYIIYVGLHSLYMPVAGISDLNIFVETDEELKNEWKITRDTHERGYTKEQVLKNINRRKEDEIKYIYPQKNNADLIIKFEKINGRVELKYENVSLSELAENIVEKLCSLYSSTIDFIELCRKVSLDPALVQDKGGNISSKTNNGMIIKSSGFKMSDMSLSNGYCVCSIPEYIPKFNCESEYMRYISELKKGGKNNPSMETGFHLKLKSAIVCHTHPIHLNAILCSDQALNILSNIFKEYDFEFVEYTTPGFELIDKINGEKNIIFLQNHGLIVHYDDPIAAFLVTNFINEKCKQWLIDNTQTLIRTDNLTDIKPLFPDAAVLKNEMEDINKNILHMMSACNLTPKFLPDKEIEKLNGMTAEKLRKVAK